MSDLINYNLPTFEFADSYLYHYRAKVVDVYDGDTIRVNIDLGFGINWSGDNGKGVSIRLYGLDTPEIRGEERPEGLVARDRLREEILDQYITLKTIKDKTGKYGRYLGVIIKEDGTNVNEWLISEGLAERKDY